MYGFRTYGTSRPGTGLLFHGVQKFPARLLAAPASLGADPAVLHVSMPLAIPGWRPPTPRPFCDQDGPVSAHVSMSPCRSGAPLPREARPELQSLPQQ
jgi:hypothetical protein